GELRDGMTIGIGGWGSRRKPMALVRELLRSDVRDLTVVSYGGPDVGLLCAAGKVRKVVFAFVSLDSIPLEPHFRTAKQAGVVDTADLLKEGSHHTLRISRLWIDGVIETPNGAHFTSCVPDYERDEGFQTEYAKAAATPEAWAEFKAAWLDVSEDDYQRKVSER